MTVYQRVQPELQTIQPDLASWSAEARKLIGRKVVRRIIRAVLISLLALTIFLAAPTPVIANASDRNPATEGLTVHPPAPPDGAHLYAVQPGDALIRIAVRRGVTLNELAAANDLDPNALVYVGQRLVVPKDAAGSPPSSVPATLDPDAADPQVPNPLPGLPVWPLEQPAAVVPFTYARVIQDDAPVFGDPVDAGQGLPLMRTLGVGYIWVSVQGKTTFAGQDFFQINAGEYVPAQALSIYNPSVFQGVALAAQPERPFAWILTPVKPSFTPQGEVNATAPVYQRYQLVQIFATEFIGDQVWYLIGPDQWINQIYVGKVAPTTPPPAVETGEKWIQVNLFEQTLAAYEGERMVYATLVSSGLPGWNTPTGLNRVWLKVRAGKMSGGYDRPDYYFLEDVPWTMYFNKDVALHTAYWHDGFGYRRSHGCVNLAPLDARWLFEWAPDDIWVWVQAG